MSLPIFSDLKEGEKWFGWNELAPKVIFLSAKIIGDQ